MGAALDNCWNMRNSAYSMKNLLVLIFAALAGPLAAQENTYEGTFTATVGYAHQSLGDGTFSAIPGMAIGDSFTGWYSYQSLTLDTPTDSAPTDVQQAFYQSIQGDIVFPGVANFSMYSGDTMDLQVQNGQLTVFYAGPDDGPASGNFVMAGSWGFESSAWNAGIIENEFPGDADLGGSLSFTDPVLEAPEFSTFAAINSVPDVASTATLVAISFAFIFCCRRSRLQSGRGLGIGCS